MKPIEPVQFIEKEGKPEWAVIPYNDFLRFQELADISHEIEIFKKELSLKREELLPSEYAERLVLRENTIKVWREYRGLTQAKLAEKIGISTPYLSQIENNERRPSSAVLKKLATTLKVSLDDLI